MGHVACTGKPEIIRNTARDRRYIVDDQQRLSEIAVPIIVEGKVFGVIDQSTAKKISIQMASQYASGDRSSLQH